jgi:predicted nucleic acid-binding protein
MALIAIVFAGLGVVIGSSLKDMQGFPEQVWRLAGRAFQAYAKRRRKQRDQGARRSLADFVIGAHAAANGCRLLTLDGRLNAPHFQPSQ